MTNYKASKDLEIAAVQMKSLSPSVLAQWVLNNRNKVITPESITVFFKRNPDLKQRLDEKITGFCPDEKQVVDAALFENGNFRETPSVKEWLLFMNMRRRKNKGLHPEYINSLVRTLKQVCLEYSKHPDRLTFRDAQEIFLAKEKLGIDTCHFRKTLKDFLKSKGDNEYVKIGVGKPRGFGQYKDLFVPKETLEKMLEYIRPINFQVYTMDMLMYHNGLRIQAVVESKIEDFKTVRGWKTLTVLEKFREVKTFKIVKVVGDLIETVIGDRQSGKIFSFDEDTCSSLNNEAIDAFCPEIRETYKHIHPNHFWRHMCAQHLLRVTDRNSKAVAALLQCSEQSLNESYGAATSADVEKWENEYLHLL